MMTRTRFLAAALALAALLPASASAQENAERVNIYQYAVDHPVPDVPLPSYPSLGASVPQTIELQRIGDDPVYGYFYFEGRPVIVDLTTRAVVRFE